jgi:hypothetical protein
MKSKAKTKTNGKARRLTAKQVARLVFLWSSRAIKLRRCVRLVGRRAPLAGEVLALADATDICAGELAEMLCPE